MCLEIRLEEVEDRYRKSKRKIKDFEDSIDHIKKELLHAEREVQAKREAEMRAEMQ